MSRNKVFVHNLPYSCERREIMDIFDKCGEIADVEILRSRDGKSRGICVIEFETEQGADRCIRKMNHYEFEGRIITLREDRGTGYIHPATDKWAGPSKGEKSSSSKGGFKGYDKGDRGGYGKGYKDYSPKGYGKSSKYGGGSYGKRGDSRRRGGGKGSSRSRERSRSRGGGGRRSSRSPGRR